jgi:hypothetical protein
MSTPVPDQSNPTNAQPPHATSQPDNQQQQSHQPVVVNAPDAGLAQRVNEMGRTLAALPEQLVNAMREATQPAQAPAQQTPVQQLQQGGQNAQQPGTDNNPQNAPDKPAETGTSTKGPKVSRFASWYYKK